MPTPPERTRAGGAPPDAAALTLEETQRRFFELITAPERVGRTLEQRGLDASFVEEMVNGDGRRSAVGRLDVYAHMYFFRLLDVLEADHPALRAALGDDRFHNLATDYLQAHPSQDPSVRHVSRHLPELLAEAEGEWLPGWPRQALVELAAMEQARLDCFDAAEAPLLTLDDVRGHSDIASLPLSWIPASRRLACGFAVDECWAQANEGGEPEPPAEAPRLLLVWRQGVDVYHRVVDDGEAPLLEAHSFGEVCERLAAGRPPEEAAARAFELLARWVGDGLLTTRESG